MPMETERFGNKLKELRRRRGCSQRRLAEMLMVSNTTVANWESGRRLPDIAMLTHLADCLGAEPQELMDGLHGPGEPPRVIAVEDAPVILKSLVRTLEDELPDAEVHGFRTAAEALDFAHANRVAIAFLDIELPGESGVELAERLGELEEHTNIIFLTCHTEYMRDALNSHCSGYILKPLTRESLWHELAHLRFPVRGIGR